MKPTFPVTVLTLVVFGLAGAQSASVANRWYWLNNMDAEHSAVRNPDNDNRYAWHMDPNGSIRDCEVPTGGDVKDPNWGDLNLPYRRSYLCRTRGTVWVYGESDGSTEVWHVPGDGDDTFRVQNITTDAQGEHRGPIFILQPIPPQLQ